MGEPRHRWQSQAHRRWFRFCLVCLSAYIALSACLAHSGFLTNAWATAAALLSTLGVGVGCWYALGLACSRLDNAAPKARRACPRTERRVFWAALLIGLFIFGAAFAAHYPGGVNYDVSNQWRQAHSGEFNNWHPVAHTLMIWLAVHVADSYPFVLACQILAFSAALAWLTATLVRHGTPPGWALAAHVVVALTPVVRNTLMYVGKDAAMTAGVLVLTAQAVEMLATRGAWLKRLRHAAAFGVTLGFVTLMRHNAFLWTVPLCLLVLCCYRDARRGAAVGAGAFLALALLVRGPLYGALDIVYPDNFVEESVGLPMTVLGDIRQREPQALTPEADAFLASLADEEAWQDAYVLHQYNSIKFTYDRERIAGLPMTAVWRMALQSAANAPRVAFEAVVGVTDLVWGLDGQDEGVQNVGNTGDLPQAQAQNGRLNALGRAVCAFLDEALAWLPLAYLTRNIGVSLLLLLLVSLWALYRGGVRTLTLSLPVLLYDLGTMLLLCGQDARFFQCSMAACLPCALALCFDQPQDESLQIHA